MLRRYLLSCAGSPLARPASRGPQNRETIGPRAVRSRVARKSARPSSRRARTRCRARARRRGRERLTYDQYRSIRFDPAAAIWRGENRTFAVDLLYPGFIYEVPVNINLVVGGTARRVLFKNDLVRLRARGTSRRRHRRARGLFGVSRARAAQRARRPRRVSRVPGRELFSRRREGPALRIVGARVSPFARRGPKARSSRTSRTFGSSARRSKRREIVIHALLQSPSVVGAYTFTARPGDETAVDVRPHCSRASSLTAFGIAPLTSMFLFDGSNRARFDDYRNAVHDSNGLQILNGRGERLWRPLANPRTLRTSAFLDDSPKGFGLVQRKRQFGDYQDSEAQYDRRPSLWVEPSTEWGPGHVELVEIPSPREINDNIVAYWQPAMPIPAGQSAEFSYRLRFTDEPLDARSREWSRRASARR